MATQTYLIPDCNLAELEARIAKLNKRAGRLGVAPIVVTKTPDHVKHQVSQLQSGCEIGGPATRLVWRKSIEKTPVDQLPDGAYLANAFEPTGVAMTWWAVTVSGETPKLNGWEFIATLEPLTTETGVENLVQTVPGHKCPQEFRSRVGQCDHCRATRRRNQTFVVRHEDGSHKCVGRQCIKDFLGYHGDPQQLASWAESLAELGSLCNAAGDEDWLGEGYGSSRGERSWDLVKFTAQTAAVIRLKGWVSRSVAREYGQKQATADCVLHLFIPPHPSAGATAIKEWEADVAQFTPSAKDLTDAEAALEWVKALPATELEGSDYLANCNLVARVGTVSPKTAGIAASILVAYCKAVEKEVNRQKAAAKPPSNHIGEVGKRLKGLTVTCEKVIAHEGYYGVSYITKLTDAAGNDLAWFASKEHKMEAGKNYLIDATVKKHEAYQGRLQTVVTRVTVKKELTAAIVAVPAA